MVKAVGKFGFNELHRSVNNQYYSSVTIPISSRISYIHYYLTSGDSYLTVALKYGLPNDTLVLAWHQKFLQKGIQDLSSKPKRRPSMSKKTRSSEKTRIREQELEHENELLRAELSFMKSSAL